MMATIDLDYPRIGAKKILLALAWIFVVFYPFKGLPGAALFYAAGIDNFSDSFIPIAAALALISAFLVFAFYGRRIHKRETALFLLGLALIGIALSRGQYRDIGQYYYLIFTFLLFVLPFILTPMVRISDIFIRKIVTAFFLAVSVYGVGEHIVFHTHLYGLTDYILVDSEKVLEYYSLTAYKSEPEDVREGTLIDYREFTPYGAGGRLRTGGFLGQHMKMAALFSLAAIFFYVSWRRRSSWRQFVPFCFAFFSLVNCLSTNAIVSFFLAIIAYEFYFNRGIIKKLIISALVLGGAVMLVYFPTPITFLYHSKSSGGWNYFSTFLPIKTGEIYNMSWAELAFSFIAGRHGWLTTGNKLYTENDIFNLVTTFGAVIAFFLFRRWIVPVFHAKKIGDDSVIVFAMTVLGAVFLMMHDGTIIHPNIFPMITLLNLKSYDLIRRLSSQGIRTV